MVAGYGVVECLPQPLDVIDPRVVGGLEEQREFRIARQPASCDVALVNNVVIEDEHDAPRPAIGALELVEQVDEQQGVFSLALDPHHLAGARVQSAGEVVFLVLPRRWDSALGAARHPGQTDSRVEVDIGFVAKEHLGAGVFIGQCPGNCPHSL